jgi:enamine deaminase RidA (YjgF/YER057c/UK114 family)
VSGRKLVSSGGPWEDRVGYSRAVRAGNTVYVAGTTAVGPGGMVYGSDDGYLQAKRCLEVIAEALAESGASLADVVRTRMFVTDIGRWEEFARAHAEAFGTVRPAATMVEVQRLIAPGLLIEIEVDAVISDR